MNRIRCTKCMEIIESKFRHDFVWCKCKTVFIDGGKDYLRCGGDLKCIEVIDDDGKAIKLDHGEG
jgi:hypothetical protein